MYLKTFLELVASFCLSMSPWRAMATPFVPEIMDFLRFATPYMCFVNSRNVSGSSKCHKLYFYDVFLKVRLTKCCKGCTGFSEISILLCVFEGQTHQVLEGSSNMRFRGRGWEAKVSKNDGRVIKNEVSGILHRIHRIQRKRGQALQLRPSHPHAPGARMT